MLTAIFPANISITGNVFRAQSIACGILIRLAVFRRLGIIVIISILQPVINGIGVCITQPVSLVCYGCSAGRQHVFRKIEAFRYIHTASGCLGPSAEADIIIPVIIGSVAGREPEGGNILTKLCGK